MAPEKLQLPLPFEQIMQCHEREIMRYLLRVSCNGADAADLFQETWLRAYRAYPRLEPGSEIRPWLYAIAVNLCRNRARDGVRRARVIVAQEEKNPAVDRMIKGHRGFSENEGYAAVGIVKSPLGDLLVAMTGRGIVLNHYLLGGDDLAATIAKLRFELDLVDDRRTIKEVGEEIRRYIGGEAAALRRNIDLTLAVS